MPKPFRAANPAQSHEPHKHQDVHGAVKFAGKAQVLGPAENPLIAVDGKKLRHAAGVELVSAFGVKSGR